VEPVWFGKSWGEAHPSPPVLAMINSRPSSRNLGAANRQFVSASATALETMQSYRVP
jgi:hypothetical protein